MAFDLLLTGGDVIDVGGGHVGRFDVGVRGGRIAAMIPAPGSPGLRSEATREGGATEGAGIRASGASANATVDASGRLITPGLVDMHTHIHPGATFWGVDPDPIAWYSGVTTWVDAGSAGAYSIAALRASAREVRVHALLNISAVGLIAPTGECRDLDACDVDLAAATVSANRDLIAGLKVRIDSATVGRNGLEPLRRALRVGRACGVPVMVHIGTAPPEVPDVLALLRPGDVVTHCASAVAVGLVADDKIHPAVRDAYAAGVRFDIGHGVAGFAFETLDAFLAAGLPPHTVSTDLHTRCLYGPVFDLPTTMAKMLAAGLALPEVVAAATVRPAEVLGLPGGVGTLAVVVKLDRGPLN